MTFRRCNLDMAVASLWRRQFGKLINREIRNLENSAEENRKEFWSSLLCLEPNCGCLENWKGSNQRRREGRGLKGSKSFWSRKLTLTRKIFFLLRNFLTQQTTVLISLIILFLARYFSIFFFVMNLRLRAKSSHSLFKSLKYKKKS